MKGTNKKRISAKWIILIIAAAALVALLIRVCFPGRLYELDPDDYTYIGIRSLNNGAWVEIYDRNEIEGITERLNNFGYLWRARNHSWSSNGDGYILFFYGDSDEKAEFGAQVGSGYVRIRETSDTYNDTFKVYNYITLNIFYFDVFEDYFKTHD